MQAPSVPVQRPGRAERPAGRAALNRWLTHGLPRVLGWLYIALAVMLVAGAVMPFVARTWPHEASRTAAAWLAPAADLGAGRWLAAVAWAVIGVRLASEGVRGVWTSLACAPAMALATAWMGADPAPNAWALAALTPPQVAVQFAEQASLLVALPLGWTSWLAYLAQAALLAPSVRAALRARRLERERIVRENTLTLPTLVTDLYLAHPLRVLGLTVGEARTRAIMRRRDELHTLAEAGLSVESDLPGFVAVALDPPGATGSGPWTRVPGRKGDGGDGGDGGGKVGKDVRGDKGSQGAAQAPPPEAASPPANEAQVKRAVARLQHEPERCDESLLWFQLDGEPEAVRAALARGDLDAADAIWRSRAAPGSVGHGAALYNRAVLAHHRVIASEVSSAPPHAVSNVEAWRASHRLWAQVIASPDAWQCVEGFVAQCTDPRIGPDHAQGLRSTLARRVLGVHTDLAKAAQQAGFMTYARAQLQHVELSALPDVEKKVVLDEFFRPQLEGAQEVLRPFHDTTRPLTDGVDYGALRGAWERVRIALSALGAQARLEPLARAAVVEACERLPRETYTPWRKFNDDDIACYRGTSAIIDRWNQHSGGSGGGANFDALRLLYEAMKTQRPLLAQLDECMQAYDQCATRALEAGRCVAGVAEDAPAAEREQLAKVLKDEEAALVRSRDELRKTKDHYERNLRGMGQALGH